LRLWSTQESARQGEPSLLAILETLAAMGTSVWIGVHFHMWIHVIVGFCVAPFLMLRTDASCEQGLRWFKRSLDRVNETTSPFVGILFAIVGGVPIRFLSTIFYLFRQPTASLFAVPGNWWRLTCSTDFAVSPEYLPHPRRPSGLYAELAIDYDIESVTRTYRLWRSVVYGFKEAVNERRFALRWFHWLRLLLAVPVVSFLVFSLTLSALAYRWSIKSTALGWFPLLWALKPSRPRDRDWKTHLAIESELKKPQLVAVWSLFCLATVALKYALWAIRHGLAANIDAWRAMFQRWAAIGGWRGNIANSPLAEALVNFVRPGAIPLWQVGVLLNSLLGVYVWWKIRQWLAQYKHNAPPTDGSIDRTLGVTFFFRHLLTSYVIICDGFMALQVARKLPLPEIGQKLFPWL
jgi:hypothetical protein